LGKGRWNWDGLVARKLVIDIIGLSFDGTVIKDAFSKEGTNIQGLACHRYEARAPRWTEGIACRR